MLARLNRETRVHHADAELVRGSIAAVTSPTSDDYAQYLRALYGLQAPFEAGIALTPGLDRVERRTVAGLIAADLLGLGLSAVEVAELPLCFDIQRFDAAPEALGWIYAFDRSAFHMPDVRDQLAIWLPEVLVSAGRYLASFEATRMRERWNALGDALDEVSGDRGVADRIVASAHAAYRCQRAWLANEQRRLKTG